MTRSDQRGDNLDPLTERGGIKTLKPVWCAAGIIQANRVSRIVDALGEASRPGVLQHVAFEAGWDSDGVKIQVGLGREAVQWVISKKFAVIIPE